MESNSIHDLLSNVITHPFSNKSLHPHKPWDVDPMVYVDVITYPCHTSNAGNTAVWAISTDPIDTEQWKTVA